jgi:hypothetical protein
VFISPLIPLVFAGILVSIPLEGLLLVIAELPDELVFDWSELFPHPARRIPAAAAKSERIIFINFRGSGFYIFSFTVMLLTTSLTP